MMRVCVKSLLKDQMRRHAAACVLERETLKLAAFVDMFKCGRIGLQFMFGKTPSQRLLFAVRSLQISRPVHIGKVL